MQSEPPAPEFATAAHCVAPPARGSDLPYALLPRLFTPAPPLPYRTVEPVMLDETPVPPFIPTTVLPPFVAPVPPTPPAPPPPPDAQPFNVQLDVLSKGGVPAAFAFPLAPPDALLVEFGAPYPPAAEMITPIEDVPPRPDATPLGHEVLDPVPPAATLIEYVDPEDKLVL